MRTLGWIAVALLCLSGCGVFGGGEDGDVTYRGTVTAGSMDPALRPGDKVVATKVAPGELRPGDVIAYRDPGGWLGADSHGGTLIHRVIGTPGDTVTCCDARGRIAVNGTALDEPYLAPDPGRCHAPLLTEFVIRPGSALSAACRWTVGPVPEGRLFVLGDNRSRAADSREHLCPATDPCPDGPWVPFDRVRGLVELP